MRYLELALSFVLILGLHQSVSAGQRMPTTPPTAPAGAEKPLEAMTIEELRAFQTYYYASGGRDPLTMRLPTSSELGDPKGPAKKAPTLEEMDMILDQALEDIMDAIKIQDYAAAVKASDDVIYIIDNEWPPLRADPPRLRQKDEQIRNLNRMAVRLQAQAEIQREFEGLNLRVDGVTWSPTDAKAVVNARLYSAGEVMLEERRQGDLRVEIIEEHGVVFQFKGLRFRLPVEVHAAPET